MLPEIKQHTPSETKNIHILTYGIPMSGKTTFAGTFPRPLFISTDGNTTKLNGELAVIDINFNNNIYTTSTGTNIKMDGWTYFKSVIKELQTGKHDYETIVIDSLFDIFNICCDHWLKKQGVIDPGDVPFSKGYTLPRKDFYMELAKLRNLTRNINLVGIVPHRINEEGKMVQIFTDKIWPNISRLFMMVSFIAKNKKNEISLFIEENRVGIPINTCMPPHFMILSDAIENFEKNK